MQAINPYIISSTLTEQAEENIIMALFELPQFKEPNIQRKLAYYPYASPEVKNETICEIMDSIWGKTNFEYPFKTFKELEIYLTAGGQRGHFIHQFEVYLLGLNIIDVFLKNKVKFVFEDTERIYYTWLITSTAHDFGYPLQIAQKITTRLSKLYQDIGMVSLSDKFKSISYSDSLILKESDLSSLIIKKDTTSHVCETILIKELIAETILATLSVKTSDACDIQSKLITDNDHAYVSAVMLSNILVKQLLKNNNDDYNHMKDSWQFDALKYAIGAIALHASKKNETIENLAFEKNPFAYLLFIIDNIQEWNRAVVNDIAWPIYTLTHFSVTDTNKEIKLNYMLNHDVWDKDMKDRIVISLKDKKDLLEKPSGPNPPLGLIFTLQFNSNDGDSFPDVQIKI